MEERLVLYAIRLPSNAVLQWEIQHLLTRPVGRPPRKPIIWYDDFWYQAGSWDRPRRVVAKVEWHQGELFPRVGFIVTNMSASTEGVVHFYNGRGTAQQWIKEGKYALNWTRLSCHRFLANQVRLALFILAYNLGNFLRRLCLPKAVKHWSLRSVQIKLIKIGGRLVRHARRLVFQLAEVAVPKGGIQASVGTYRSSPCSTRVANILGSLDVVRCSQRGGACLEELEGSANVVEAAFVAWRPLARDAERWFCELDGMVDGVRD